jgi:hypothetical protein
MTTTESGTAFASGTVKAVTGKYLVTFTPDKLGTYLIQFKNSGGTNNATAVWTVTVVAKPAITVATLAAPTVGTVVTKNYDTTRGHHGKHQLPQVVAGKWNTWSESVRSATTQTITSRGTDDLTFACYDI